MTDAVSHILLLIATSLLWPVILLLLGLWGLSLLYLGGFITEAVARRRRGGAFRDFVSQLRRGAWPEATIDDVPSSAGLLQSALAEFRRSPRSAGKLIDDVQLRAESLLGRLHLCVRLGPMLGLAGTLIPLGPALGALAEGDMRALANSLIIAFSTTVVGLWVGGLCFAMHTVRQRWYDQDLNDLEFVLKRLGRRQRRRYRRERMEPCETSGA